MMTHENGTTGANRPTHDQIAARAARLWRERGEPSGQDDVIWLEAERALIEEASRATAPAPTPASPVAPAPAPISEVATKAPAKTAGGKKRGGSKAAR